ncbi:MAG TPA: cysteine--tRNA ligase [Mollicutes bacterium]|jgi:cysteinyl-tRNA synthetase|nr:cysteine--tRNA ligase [Mollicutes bacterium]
MKIYNTLTKRVEEFMPIDKNEVKMYTCGPTVYNYAHVGNLRTYIFEDIFEKTLNYIGYNVKRVMNITDIGHLTSDADTGEDKMLKSAKSEGKSVLEIADFYTDAFFEDAKKLNVKKPDIIEKATDLIDEYIKIISTLLEKDFAYVANGNVYFDINKIDGYYELSGRNEEDLIVGARSDVLEDKNKRNPYDFVLWFTSSKFEDQALKWDSPWGVGYPGWHIECSGISMKHFGENLDIHCGGVDNIFPHHTNEIAQSEAYLGHKWCNYWVHAEHLNDQSGKMSKSKGEFLTLSLLERKGYKPLAYRFFCLGSHYRNQLVFSYESLDTASLSYEKLLNRIKSIKQDDSIIMEKEFSLYQKRFKESLEDDLNTANALTILFEVIKSNDLNNNTKLSLIEDFDKVLSLDLLNIKEMVLDDDLVIKVEEMIKERDEAKSRKDYAKADEIRDYLLSMGIVIKDSREGTTYEIKEG